MSRPVISVEGLSKEYIIGGRDRANETFREMLMSSLAAPFRRFLKLSGEAAPEERFWALKDVSFEVNEGEVLGIIGRNGAGKSTLLKILSRITEPTEGRVHIRGRVASLLEVGTGFHPELTGRENIYLNGAILGMKQAEIRRKFDGIVEFSGVERFIDTPVKRYSSGMYVRLAFAVAAHLDPEVLIVDEVLAVGDAEFQKKCLGKMQDVGRSGRTVIFVSHNMSAIQKLCGNCILMEEGRIASLGSPTSVSSHYLLPQLTNHSFVPKFSPNLPASIVRAELTRITDEDALGSGFGLLFRVWIEATAILNVGLDVYLKDSLGNPIGMGALGGFGSHTRTPLREGTNKVSFVLSTDKLAIGSYWIDLSLSKPGVTYYQQFHDCFNFSVERNPDRGPTDVFRQDWGGGSIELPLSELVELPQVEFSSSSPPMVLRR